MTISSLYLLQPTRADQNVIKKATSEIRYDTKFGMCSYKDDKKNFNKTQNECLLQKLLWFQDMHWGSIVEFNNTIWHNGLIGAKRILTLDEESSFQGLTQSLWGKSSEIPRQKCTNKRVMNYQFSP